MTDFGMPYLIDCGTIERCAALAHELHLQFVEINIGFPDCLLTTALEDRLNRLREQYGIYFTLHMDEQADPFTFNEDVREAWRTVFFQAIDLAKKCGIPVINMHLPRGSWITLPDRRVFMYEQYSYLDAVSAFRDACTSRCANDGPRICIENTDGFLPFEQAAVEQLLTSDTFGLTLDIGHCHAAGNADEPFYRAHSAKLAHMHAHDTAGRHDHLPFGAGDIDLPERLAWAMREHARILLEVKTTPTLRQTVEVLPVYLQKAAEMR